MSAVVADAIQEIYGETPNMSVRIAPEHERSGSA
jgi:hypothetical protein